MFWGHCITNIISLCWFTGNFWYKVQKQTRVSWCVHIINHFISSLTNSETVESFDWKVFGYSWWASMSLHCYKNSSLPSKLIIRFLIVCWRTLSFSLAMGFPACLWCCTCGRRRYCSRCSLSLISPSSQLWTWLAVLNMWSLNMLAHLRLSAWPPTTLWLEGRGLRLR